MSAGTGGRRADLNGSLPGLADERGSTRPVRSAGAAGLRRGARCRPAGEDRGRGRRARTSLAFRVLRQAAAGGRRGPHDLALDDQRRGADVGGGVPRRSGRSPRAPAGAGRRAAGPTTIFAIGCAHQPARAPAAGRADRPGRRGTRAAPSAARRRRPDRRRRAPDRPAAGHGPVPQVGQARMPWRARSRKPSALVARAASRVQPRPIQPATRMNTASSARTASPRTGAPPSKDACHRSRLSSSRSGRAAGGPPTGRAHRPPSRGRAGTRREARPGSQSASRSCRPHTVTRTNASLTIEPLILLRPNWRSAKVIGTSVTRAPERTARQAQSTWKQ